MSIITAVRKSVLELNPEWFLQKKQAFEGETFYLKRLNKIYEKIRIDNYIFDEGKEIDASRDIEIDIDLNQYCWSDYYPECRSSHPQVEELLPINASYISNEIVRLVEKTLDGVADIKASYATIMTVVSTVKEAIIELIRNKNGADVEYSEALNHFFKNFKGKLSTKYGYIKRVHDLSADYSPKLNFNINQNQLAALLFILNEAEMFINITSADTDFINFCKEHFTFKHRTKHTQEKPTELRNKFNNAKDHLPCVARDEVARMLFKKIKEYNLKG